MESIGARLQGAREKKGLSLDQIARETNIARRYLQAMEDEDFQAFPGEPYFLGFLRNYSEYLGINSGELVQIYKSIKIQEQPIPVEALLKKDRTLSPIAVIGLCVLGVGLLIGLLVLVSTGAPSATTANTSPKLEMSIDLAAKAAGKGSYRQYFVQGQELTVPQVNGNQQYVVLISQILEDSGSRDVIFEVNKNKYIVGVGMSKELAFDQGNAASVKATVYNIDAKENTADIEFEFMGLVTLPGQTAAPLSSALPAMDTSKPDTANAIVLFEVPAPGPFNVVVTYKNFCFFRIVKDGKETIEKFVRKGASDQQSAERFEGMNNTAKLGTSNANACKVVIEHAGMSKELFLGGPGEVVMKWIKWERDDSSGSPRYKLVAYPLY